MTYFNYVSFYLFFIIYLFVEIESFTPAGRHAHSSVLVGNKLYFLGGLSDAVNDYTNEVFYLDVSKPFNTQAPPWNDLTQSARIPFKSSWATASLSNVNNEQTIYLFGGIAQDLVTSENNVASMVYSFNLNSLKWNVPTVKGMQPERRRDMRSVIDNTGKMYIFGGSTSNVLGSPIAKTFNEMVIFNTVELSWSISTSPTILSRAGHTATILSNGVIVYIGGFDSEVKNLDISQITLYDTKSLTWSNKVCCMNVNIKK
jgi:N-acetylneuraminic acid mutarotase